MNELIKSKTKKLDKAELEQTALTLHKVSSAPVNLVQHAKEDEATQNAEASVHNDPETFLFKEHSFNNLYTLVCCIFYL